MHRLTGLAGGALGAVGVVALAECGYLATLSTAALVAPAPRPPRPLLRSRVVVLVPAHDEQALVERCVASLLEQTCPRELYRVVVVADNCSDATAERARATGAEVLERHDPAARGKGRALAWAIGQALADQPWEAVAVVDADSVADPGLVAGLLAALEDGADAVQGEYLVLEEEQGPRALLRSAAFLLFHRVRFRGRAALGLPCSLVGNGMLFRRSLLQAHPWQAFSGTEDLEHTLDLREAGVRPVFAPDARLRAPVLAGGRGARTQRTRWESGRLQLVRTRLPGLVRQSVLGPRRDVWDAALDLAVPPLGLLAPGVLAGSAVAGGLALSGLVSRRVALPWLGAALLLPAHVLVGLRTADAPAPLYRALLAAPSLVASELVTRLGRVRTAGAGEWERTQRPDEQP